ncbi:alpha/beta hydrolase fold-domain-containing protein [Multifurca ochricompacta]|uniref:Alpha/beta hydrolase fold-domain-containing protein n=1 Tax=Multifurca ochricompacta TaxID=376703 RepID=A0AAD4MHB5_9AGAM|nr:alpha/beta hydrolase fold-domain-containing protein [Multifurca ochricompacta]
MVKPNALHPSIISRLDPEYVVFHNEHLINLPQVHELPWDPAIRNTLSVPGSSSPLSVEREEDYNLSRSKVRVFTPEGSQPESGWPVFIFFHGGGWTLGNKTTENAFCTNMCKGAKCVVVSVDYRLAPENPYPEAVEDAVEALQWVWEQGASTLGIDPKRIAVGGSSRQVCSGGNLAAVLTHKAAQLYPPIPLTFQLLIVPVTDNTASASGVPHASWLENKHTPWLSPERMLWFRRQYLPQERTRARWDASPLLAQDEMFRSVPKAWIAVMELDILRDEGIAYGKKLLKAGVPTEIKTYRGAPHPIMAMDGTALSVGKQLVSDAAAALAQALETA